MPANDDNQFWQDWGATKEQITQIHKAIYNGGTNGLISRITRLEGVSRRLTAFVFCISIAGAASAHTFLEGNGHWIPGVVGIGASIAAIVVGGWGAFKN